jgi:galactokinase
MDTGVRRALAESEYNDRLASCQRAVEALRRTDSSITALRDANIDLLVAVRDQLDDTSFRRAQHVIEENERPLALASALSAGRLAEAGSLMNDSHTSLRKLYEVSSPELDLITDLARDHAACFGARLTGAGFGGCAIAPIASDSVTDFISEVHDAYSQQIDLPSAFFACRPAGGAKLRDADTLRALATTDTVRE